MTKMINPFPVGSTLSRIYWLYNCANRFVGCAVAYIEDRCGLEIKGADNFISNVEIMQVDDKWFLLTEGGIATEVKVARPG